jgi:quinol monooxygenase YgiN
MSKKVIVASTVNEGVLDKLLPFLEANLPNTRGFKGCLNVTVFLDETTRRMIFDEEWLSVEDHRKYIDAISGTGVMGELVAFLEAPPEIGYFDRMDM